MATQVYSDGAAVNNLPVNVAREMGADIVIAVYLDTGPFDKTSLSSLVGVAGRNVEIMISANELESMKDANILLKADVSKFTSGDFEKSAEIIPQGVQVAEAHAAELEKYAVERCRLAGVCEGSEIPGAGRLFRSHSLWTSTECMGCSRPRSRMSLRSM